MLYPTKGQKFTISANKNTRDRSWTRSVLECTDANSLSVVCKDKSADNIVLLKSEHDFALMPEPEGAPKFTVTLPQSRFDMPGADEIAERLNRERSFSWPGLREAAEKIKPKCKFYKDQPVLVRVSHFVPWRPAYATGEADSAGNMYVYISGATSRTAEDAEDNTKAFRYCKPDPDALNILNWIDHDGSSNCPVGRGTLVVVEFEKGYGIHSVALSAMRAPHFNRKVVKKYCVITKP